MRKTIWAALALAAPAAVAKDGGGREQVKFRAVLGVSRSFAAADGVSYALVVTDAAGDDAACGEFERTGGRREGKDGGEALPGDACQPLAGSAMRDDELEDEDY